jgi:hypothetical protein
MTSVYFLCNSLNIKNPRYQKLLDGKQNESDQMLNITSNKGQYQNGS